MGGNLFRCGTFGDLSIGGCEVAGGTEVIYLRRGAAGIAGPLTGTVFHSRLVHYEDDVAIQLEDWVVNPAEAPGYLEQDFTAITPDSYLSAVSRREPCLLIRRRTWSSHGLVSAARLLHPGSRSRFEGTFSA
jgi:GntR family transcriptional regulator, histidine utilization repressor